MLKKPSEGTLLCLHENLPSLKAIRPSALRAADVDDAGPGVDIEMLKCLGEGVGATIVSLSVANAHAANVTELKEAFSVFADEGSPAAALRLSPRCPLESVIPAAVASFHDLCAR